jgi:hypothetical protein
MWTIIIIAQIAFRVSDGVATLLCERSPARSPGIGDSTASGEKAKQFQIYAPAHILPSHEVLGFT